MTVKTCEYLSELLDLVIDTDGGFNAFIEFAESRLGKSIVVVEDMEDGCVKYVIEDK